MPAQRFSRRTQEREDRRLRLLEAAEAVFCAHGYEGASIAEIARRADFATGTVYLYFEDKADLYATVLSEKFKQLVSRVEEALNSDSSATDCLRAWVRAQFSFHDTNRKFFEIFLNQHQMNSSTLSGHHWRQLESLKRRHLSLVEECIKKGQAGGELKAGDARMYAVAFLGVTLQIIRQWLRDDRQESLLDFADFAANCFLQGAAALQSVA